jgi:hypothetical protein
MTPCEQKGYKIGDRFRVVKDSRGLYSAGSIVGLAKDDGSTIPWFNLVVGNCSVPDGRYKQGRACLRLDDIERHDVPLRALAMPPKKPTPCEEKGYKVGDRFNVIKGSRKGKIVQLYQDDGTGRPLFHEVKPQPIAPFVDTSHVMCIGVAQVRPCTYPIPQAPEIKIEIKRPKESRKTRPAREAEEFMTDKSPLFHQHAAFAMRLPVHAAKGPVPRNVRRKVAEYIQEHYEADGDLIKRKSEQIVFTVNAGGLEAFTKERLDKIIEQVQVGVKQSPHAMGRAFDFRVKMEMPADLYRYKQAMIRSLAFNNLPRSPLFDSIFNSKPTQEEKKTMDIKIKKVTFVNNTDINEYSDDRLFGLIADAEATITHLEKIESKPKKLVDEIKQRKADIATLVKLIDGKK